MRRGGCCRRAAWQYDAPVSVRPGSLDAAKPSARGSGERRALGKGGAAGLRGNVDQESAVKPICSTMGFQRAVSLANSSANSSGVEERASRPIKARPSMAS